MESTTISTQNDFLFSSDGRTISPMLPVHITTRQQAYRTAAWIKAMALVLPDDGPDTSTYEQIEQAINNT